MALKMLLIWFVTLERTMEIIFVLLLLVSVFFTKLIETMFNIYVNIGHPEGHIDNEDKEDDLMRLKEKVDAGADLIVTQLFFDVDIFIQFVKRCKDIGITCPILPGIFPIQSYGGLKRVISFNDNAVPQQLWDNLEPIKDDDQAVKDYGIELAVKYVQKIKEETGINGFHIYTFNLERSSRLILEKLGLVREQEHVKPLPWNPVSKIVTERRFFLFVNILHYLLVTWSQPYKGNCTSYFLEKQSSKLYSTYRILG